MDGLTGLLGTTQRQALEFFVVGLKDVSDADVDQRELLYTASVLAHDAQVSTHAHDDVPTPATLVHRVRPLRLRSGAEIGRAHV